MREYGRVARFQKTFGFITTDAGGRDLFVHQTAIESSDAEGYRELREGARVSFERAQDDQGRPCARAVREER